LSRPDRLRVFVLVDALGWKLLEDREFLSDVLPYRRPLRTVLGYSSAAIPTLLSGRLPAEHGHWNLLYYDPQGSPFRWLRRLSFLPEAMLEHRVGRKLLKELGRRVLGLGPLFECTVSPRHLPWFNWVEKRNIYAPGGLRAARSIFDQLVEKGVPYRAYSYHRFRDAEILDRASSDVDGAQARVFFLYLSELDALLHHHGSDEPLVEGRLSWYADRLGSLLAKARRRDPNAVFALFSDHGMTPVRYHCDLGRDVDSLGFRMPEDYLAVYDSTMARFWFFTPGARQSIGERLGQLPYGRLIAEPELRRLGVYFPDQRYGEGVYLLNPGWLIAGSGFHGNGWRPVGMHGYHPEDAYSDGVFLASDPPSLPVRTVAEVCAYMQQAWS